MSNPTTAAAALLASTSIFYTIKRQPTLNSNFHLQSKTWCESSTLNTEILDSAKQEISSPQEILGKVKTRAEVARRFIELAARSAVVLVDYKIFFYENDDINKNLENLDPDDPKIQEYNELLSSVHKRAATSLYDACVSHGGLLIKMGQYLSNLSGFIPMEYLEALRPLQDSCSPVPIDYIRKELQSQLSPTLSSSSSLLDLDDVEVEPLGSASLAQVHKATLKDGTVVAIKIQRPELEASTNADIVALQLLSKIVDIAFPGAGFEWLLPEFHQTIAAELDFTQEARNMIRCSKMLQGCPLNTKTSFWSDWFWPSFLAGNSYAPPKAFVPTPILELSTNKILTMTYEEGFRITDMEKLQENSINPKDVASAACALFSDLTFQHGFVHADPHPGNILVRPRHSSERGAFDIVLLDHGMYRRLEDDFRLHYSNLWAGLVSGDYDQALQGVRGMGLDDKYLDVFGIMLVYRLPINIGIGNNNNSIFAQQRLGSIMDSSSRKELRKKLEGSFGENVFSSSAANSFLESLPRDLLFCLRCNNLVRGLNRTLGGTSLDRFVAFGSAASRGSNLVVQSKNDAFSSDEISSLFTKSEAEYFTTSTSENQALRLAKEMLNRPVASERDFVAKKSFSPSKPDMNKTFLPSFLEFLDSYKVVWRVWTQTVILDFFLWYRGTKGSDNKTINLG